MHSPRHDENNENCSLEDREDDEYHRLFHTTAAYNKNSQDNNPNPSKSKQRSSSSHSQRKAKGNANKRQQRSKVSASSSSPASTAIQQNSNNNDKSKIIASTAAASDNSSDANQMNNEDKVLSAATNTLDIEKLRAMKEVIDKALSNFDVCMEEFLACLSLGKQQIVFSSVEDINLFISTCMYQAQHSLIETVFKQSIQEAKEELIVNIKLNAIHSFFLSNRILCWIL